MPSRFEDFPASVVHKFPFVNQHNGNQADNESEGVSSADGGYKIANTTSQPASTGTSAPRVVVLPKTIHGLQEDFNDYNLLSAEQILYGKDSSGDPMVPEEHVYGGVFLEALTVYTICEIAKAVNDEKMAAGKEKITRNSYTKPRSAALIAKATADAARKGGQVNVYKALVDADVAAGRTHEAAEASRSQKWTGSRNGTYGTGTQATAVSSATSQPERKRFTLDEHTVEPPSKRHAASPDDAHDQASVMSQAVSYGTSDEQNQSPAGSEHIMRAQSSSTTALNGAGLYAMTPPSSVPEVPAMTVNGHGNLSFLPMDAGLTSEDDDPFSSKFEAITEVDSEQAMAEMAAFLDANPQYIYFES
ncbi:hypothetical protein BST61_g1122 [Cercospora zeina]